MYTLNAKLINSDFYKTEDLNVLIEQNYHIIEKKYVELNEKEISFNLKNGEYKIYAMFSVQGLAYCTPKIFISIPETVTVTLDISKAEIDDVLVDPI